MDLSNTRNMLIGLGVVVAISFAMPGLSILVVLLFVRAGYQKTLTGWLQNETMGFFATIGLTGLVMGFVNQMVEIPKFTSIVIMFVAAHYMHSFIHGGLGNVLGRVNAWLGAGLGAAIGLIVFGAIFSVVPLVTNPTVSVSDVVEGEYAATADKYITLLNDAMPDPNALNSAALSAYEFLSGLMGMCSATWLSALGGGAALTP